MRALLIIGSSVEILLVVIVLTVYLVKIARSLRRTADTLAKVAFGVRAIDQQVAPLGRRVIAINEQLEALAADITALTGALPTAGAGTGGRRRRSRGGS